MTDHDNDRDTILPDDRPPEAADEQPVPPPLPPDADPGQQPTLTDVYALSPDELDRLAARGRSADDFPASDAPPNLPPMSVTQQHVPVSASMPTQTMPHIHMPDEDQSSPPPRTQPVRQVTPPRAQQPVPPARQQAGPQAGYRPPQQQASYRQPPPPPPASGRRPTANRPARGRSGRKRRRFRLFSGGCLLTVLAALLVFACLLVVVGAIVWSNLSAQLEDGLQALDDLGDRRVFQTTIIYDRHGSELYQVFDEGRRTTVELAALPPYVAQASIAVEDDSFYTNPGVDIISIIRAAFQNVQTTGDAFSGFGASTITQQVVRNVAFDYEYRVENSLQRKIEEAILSIILTSRLSKDEILELYLNEIYYGNLAYGIEAASQTIFGHPAAELTLGEAALLAGLPQSPAWLDPLNPDPDVQEAVLDRRRLVIDLMLEENFITAEEARAAYGEPLSYASPDVSLTAPHFTVFARDELESLMATLGYPPDLITAGGLRVYTTLDLRIQAVAEQTALEQVQSLRDAHNLTNAAVVVAQPVTGQILAMVGSVDYWDDSIDGRVNVTLAPRQPGSTMKPFTYAAAIEQGWTPAHIIWDTEVHFNAPGQPEYVPVNYDGAFHGPVRMRDALANSYNIPAVQTLRQVGVPYLLDLMQRFGVESLGDDANRYGLSLTLGGGEVSLLELTRAYSVFANHGVLVPTTSILCVLDADDNIIYQYDDSCPRGQATGETVDAPVPDDERLDPRIAFVISDMLADNAARTPAMGSRSPLYTGNIISSVKTGTTNDTRDNWTVGYTRNIIVGVWAGNSDNSPMINTSGLTGAAPIWNAVLTAIYSNPDLLAVLADNGQLVPDALSPPPGLSRVRVCEVSALQDPAGGCPAERVEWMLDSRALIPDANGNMVESDYRLSATLVTPDLNANGPQLTEFESGLFQALALPLSEDLARLAQTTLAANAGPGGPTPPTPRYCLVPNEVAAEMQGRGAQTLVFIGPPGDATDAIYAAQYALPRNIPILPPLACSSEMLGAVVQGGGSGPPVVTAYISSPAPNEQVTSDIPIVGTADFGPNQAQYYKIEIRGTMFPEWVTLGDVHPDRVIDGQLEWLSGSGLQSGTYFIRLVLVGIDGNYLQNPYEVPFTVP